MTSLPVDVTAIVVAYRSGEQLEACIDSVLGSCDVRARVIVVNNDPGDSLPARLVSSRTDADLIEASQNVGFCTGVNLGLERSDSPYVVLLNPDARIGDDYLTRLIERMERDPTIGSSGGRLLRSSGSDVFIDSVGLRMLRGRRPIDMGHGTGDDGIRSGAWDVFGVTAAAAVYRRSALREVAVEGVVLPDEFFMYLDDVDLAWRLRLWGYRSVVDHAAVAWHARDAAGDTNAPPRGWRRLWVSLRREASRPDYVRERSWVNQLLMLIRCDEPSAFLDQLPYFAARRMAHEGFTLLQSPGLAVRARLRFATLASGALRQRRIIQAGRRVPPGALARWLP